MKSSTKLSLGLLGLLVGALLLRVALTPGPSDEELIRTALEDSVKASREGRPGNVLELLSNEFTVNDQQMANSREIARVVREFKPDLEIENYRASVDGDRATLVSPVTLKAQGVFPLSARLSKVIMEFVKVPAPRYLVLPGHRWKLERVTIAPESFQDLAGSFGA